jgi:hypothetical protein
LAAEITGLAVEYDLFAKVEIPVLIIVRGGCNELEGCVRNGKKRRNEEARGESEAGFFINGCRACGGRTVDRLSHYCLFYASIVSCSVAPS